MRVCLFEDRSILRLGSLIHSRPVFDLVCGFTTTAQKFRRLLPKAEMGCLVRSSMTQRVQTDHPRWTVNDWSWLREESCLWINARWLPTAKQASLQELGESDHPFAAVLHDQIAYAWIPETIWEEETSESLDDLLPQWLNLLPRQEAEGEWIGSFADLIEQNSEQLAVDYFWLHKDEPTTGRPATLTLLGPSFGLHVDPTARIDPFVVADTSNGPVIIDRDAVITSFSRLEGPCYIGPRTQILRAEIRGGTTIGADCSVGGEVDRSIVVGNVKKPHEGLLAKSYLGEWIIIESGCQLQNCTIGDYARLAAGAMLTHGCEVGPFGSVLSSGDVPCRLIPPFAFVDQGMLLAPTNPTRLFDLATMDRKRRGEQFTTADKRFYESLFVDTYHSRRKAVQEQQQRLLPRKTA